MCFGGGQDSLAATSKANAPDQMQAYRLARAKALSTGEYDSAALGGPKPAGWDTWDKATRERYVTFRTDDPAKAAQLAKVYGEGGVAEFGFKGVLGDEYTDPLTGRSKSSGPPAPDITDDLLQQARANTYLRLQSTRGRKSTFSNAPMGTFDVSKPVLGGY